MSGNNIRMLDHISDDEFENLLKECGCEMGNGEGADVLMQNLAKIHEYSGLLMNLCGQMSEVEDWIQDKVSKTSQSISDVKHYLEYKTSAYAVQQNDSMNNQPDMGERMPTMAQQTRLPGERLDVMGQQPSMTSASAAYGTVSGNEDMGGDMETTLPSHGMPIEPTQGMSLKSVFVGDGMEEPEEYEDEAPWEEESEESEEELEDGEY